MAEEKQDHGPRIGADPELFVAIRDASTVSEDADKPVKKTKSGNVISKTKKTLDVLEKEFLDSLTTKAEKEKKAEIVAACGRIGGSKGNPRRITAGEMAQSIWGSRLQIDGRSVGDFAVQEDNVMFEFNIPASSRPEYFANNIHYFVEWLDAVFLAPLGLKFAWMNRYSFPEKALTHPLSKEAGCSPDYCAYNPESSLARSAIQIGQLGNQRFCGGHIHVQYNYNNVPRHVMARFMDVAVTLATLHRDKQGDRRKFYGKAGLYRPTNYGIEYRTLSNFWLTPNARGDNIPKRIGDAVISLAQTANTNPDALSAFYNKVPWPDVEKCINEEDQTLKKELLLYVAGKCPFYIGEAV